MQETGIETQAQRIAAVRSRIAAACARAGRAPGDVTLIAVSKTHDAAAIATAYAAGLRNFGENRVQEALPKIASLRNDGIRPVWHLVGHLQTNKAAAAAEAFDILHSVDSERVARVAAGRGMGRTRVLMEVNVAGEASKFGVSSREAGRLAEAIARMAHLDLIGLMTVAPQADNPEMVRPVFAGLRRLRDELGLRELSMGMTDDFEVAIEEGATFVRVGRAIFGPRTEGAGAG
jgi:pyridoxal phosphate enzyme (YggS family)